ncbi:MAG: preprotein translocase subunit YajC [Thermoguttaceae bacterium]|nr:preprotein translocase subunit YajC [Thermoguttaceae bacterium]MDO4858265.1 preprotein translocase subunit YajC [Thermoguttaceae bacterium]
MMNTMLLLAQASDASSTAAPASQNQLLQLILWLVIIFAFMWFFMILPQQRERRQRQQMWDSIKVYDKVVTAGGIHGVVTQINKDDGTLTLRIDESNNTKIKLEISCVAIVESSDDDKKE